jgi:hypothetical protein
MGFLEPVIILDGVLARNFLFVENLMELILVVTSFTRRKARKVR